MNKFILLALSFSLTGCVMAYKSSQVQKNLDKANGQFEQQAAQIDGVITQVDGIMASLKSTGAKLTDSPYNEMAKIQVDLRKSKGKLAAIRKQYETAKTPVQTVIGLRGRIRSNEPEYKVINEFPKKVEPIMERYKKEGEAMQAKLVSFQSIMKRAKIVEVDTAALRKSVEDGSNAAAIKLAELRTNIKDRLAKSKGKHASELNSMQADLDKIELQVQAVKSLEAKFRQEVGENVKVVLGPHMASHSIAAKLEAHSTEIKRLANHFTETSAELD